MSYSTGIAQNALSMNGIQTISDGFLTIENGAISNISSLDVQGDSTFEGNVDINGSLDVQGTITGNIDLLIQNTAVSGTSHNNYNNTNSSQMTTINANKLKANTVACQLVNTRKLFVQEVNISQVQAPTSSASPGQTGDICYDINYLYLYTGIGWKRVLLSSF